MTKSTTSTSSPHVVRLSTALPGPDSALAGACSKNLRLFLSGQRSAEEFERENMYALALVVEDLKFLQAPEAPPSLSEFRAKKDLERFDSSAFLKDHPEIQAYFDKQSSITWANIYNADWLERLMDFLRKEGDMSTLSKARVVYNNYPLSIYNMGKPTWKKKSLF